MTPRLRPSSQSAWTAADVAPASRGTRPKRAAITSMTSGFPTSRPSSNTALRTAMPTSSISTGSPVRSAAAVNAKAVIEVPGNPSAEKPAKRSGRTDARRAVISRVDVLWVQRFAVDHLERPCPDAQARLGESTLVAAVDERTEPDVSERA